MVTCVLLWLIFYRFCSVLLVLSRIKVCLRLFFAGSTQLFDNYLRFLGFFVGYCVRFIEFSWDLKYFTCGLWRIMMCCPNSSNFFLLYAHMCYVKIVILQILPIFNGSAENYTVFALTFHGVYPIFFHDYLWSACLLMG